jgi:hypothetical protein
MADRSDGAGAVWSHGCQKDGINIVLFEKTGDLAGRFFIIVWVGSGAHKGIVEFCNGADGAVRFEFSKPVDGEDYVYILLEPCAVKIYRRVAH